MKQNNLFLNTCILLAALCMTPIILKCSDHTARDMSLAFTPEQITLMEAINAAVQQTIAEMQTYTHNVPPFQNNRKDDDDETASYMSSDFSSIINIDDADDAEATVNATKEQIPDRDDNQTQIFRAQEKSRNKGLLCTTCGNHYINLPNHLLTHTKSMFRCPNNDCNLTFADQNRLKAHIKIHDRKRYPCNICQKTFSSKQNKKRHEQNKHSSCKQFFVCMVDGCSNSFSRKEDRTRHIHNKHPLYVQ